MDGPADLWGEYRLEVQLPEVRDGITFAKNLINSLRDCNSFCMFQLFRGGYDRQLGKALSFPKALTLFIDSTPIPR